MRRFALSALLFSLALALAGCNGMYGGSSGGNSPSITGVSPSTGPVGTSVTISGKNFGSTQGYSTVSFSGTAATPTSWSATTIIAPVPTGAATGNVVVTVGSIASNGMTFTVTSAAPTITTQPANQTVTAGQTATFTVVAGGTAPLSYQWQKNSTNIAGATSASYTTPATTTSDSGSTFRVIVSNTAGTATSNAATLTVNPAPVAPTITTQPANQTVTAGQTATFTVVAGGTAPLSYQWQKNGANISGATSASYTTPATTTSDSGSTFVVVVSNSAGTTTSNAATLTVNPAPVAPTITTQPANQTVTAGQTATFSVTATGTAPLSYQWQKNGANISGATSASYTTPATTTSDSGSTFRVIVSNTAGTATSNSATLAVTSTAPSITSLNPTSGPVGTSVAITGTNFGATQGTSTVTFNGATAAPTGWSATSITAQVPTGATSGNVVVTVGGVASNGATFMVTTGGTAFPIKASANGRYFTDANGVPWIMVADAAHHMIPAIAATSVQAYLNDRVQNGFNSINLFFMCANAGTCPASGAAFDGTLPFLTGTGPSSYDLSTPDGTYWSKVDAIITAASNLGLVVFANPIPWGTSGQNFSTTIQNNGATKDFNFGVFIGNRYKNFPNIIWSVGQDWSSWNSSASDLNDEAQLMAGIRSADPNHLMMVQLSFQQYSNQAIAQGNAAYNANLTSDFAYTYHEAYDTVLTAYNNSTVLPVVMGESNYETGNNLGLLSSAANAFITRQEMWYTMTSGATGHVWGNEHVNHFDSSYLSNLDTTATTQVKYLTNLFNQYQWWTFAPDQSHAVVTAGYGTYNGTNGNMYTATYAATTWDSSSTAIIYTPVTATLTINMSKFSAPVTARWYDPTTGTFTATSCTSAAPCVNSSTMNFITPSGPHADGSNANDWVLVLQ